MTIIVARHVTGRVSRALERAIEANVGFPEFYTIIFMSPPTIIGGEHDVFGWSVRPPFRPDSVTYSAWRDIFVLNGEISVASAE